jgi:hypothetical protein
MGATVEGLRVTAENFRTTAAAAAAANRQEQYRRELREADVVLMTYGEAAKLFHALEAPRRALHHHHAREQAVPRRSVLSEFCFYRVVADELQNLAKDTHQHFRTLALIPAVHRIGVR